jgi:sigma-E factor negative regulatory protein RseC
MSTEEGYVTRIEGDRAFVHTTRSGMCESCKSRSTCNSLGGGSDSDMEAEVINAAHARVNDRVLLKIPSGSLWKIVMLLYLIPVVFLLAGSIIGYKIGSDNFLTPELSSLIFGIGSCGISYLIIRVIAKHLNKKSEFIPQIIKIL